MEVKGVALKTTDAFVKDRFPDKYNEWINGLPDASKKIYKSGIDVSQWYPYKEGYQIPMNKIVTTIYKGDTKTCGEDIGRYSAEIALKGVYKVFIMVASPSFLMGRASKIISTYYQPCDIKVASSHSKGVTLQVTKFTEIDLVFEWRMVGWCFKALELCGCKNPECKITQSMAKGNPCTEMTFVWQ